MLVNTKCSIAATGQTVLANTWQHLCLVVDADNVQIHFQGEMFTQQVADMENCNSTLEDVDGITVVLGTLGTFSYSGEITGVRYDTKQLTTSEIEGLRSCKNSTEDNLLMKHVFKYGMVSYRFLTEQQDLCLPEAKEFVALFSVCNEYSWAKRLCERIGGRLINSSDNLKKIAADIQLSPDVEPWSVFLWMDEGVDEERGMVLSVHRDTGVYQKMSYSLDTVFFILGCMMPLGKTVYMKDDKTETMNLYSYEYRLVLITEYGEVIRRDPCPWGLHEGKMFPCLSKRFPQMKAKYAPLEDEKEIFGRHDWVDENKDGAGSLSVTVCEEDKFTCNDASCIPLERRCDGKQHCEDNSDEGSLCTVLMHPPASYMKSTCPEAQPIIKLDLTVVRVNSVSLDTNEFKINLHILVLWQDNRLTFQNLQNDTQIILDPDNINRIWSPQLVLPDAHYLDNLAIATKTSLLEEYTVQAISSGQYELQNGYEGES